MEIINKSLLCEVLGIDERLCRIDKLVDNTLFFYTFHNVGEYPNYINIYELVHKCKEWITKQGYGLELLYRLALDTKELSFLEVSLYSGQYSPDYFDMDSKDEVEGVISAAQWVLDNKDKDE